MKNPSTVLVIASALMVQTVSYLPLALAANTLAEAYRAQAAILYKQGYLEKASSLYDKAFRETEPSLGGDKINLEQAAILSEWGQVESKVADEYEQKADQERGDPLSPWRQKEKDTRKSAIEHLELAIEVQERLLGANSATCAKTLDTLATVHLNSKNYSLAESIFRKGLAIRQANFGSNSPEIGYELWQLATIAISFGPRYGEATQLCQRSLPLLIRAYGPSNPASMQCTLTLAEGLFGLKRLSESEVLARQCLNYWKRLKGENYSLTRSSQNLLADILAAMADEAQVLLRQQLDKFSPTDARLIPYIERWRAASAKAGRQEDVTAAQEMLNGMNRRPTVVKGKTKAR